MEHPLPIPKDGDVITSPRYMAAIASTTVVAVLITWLRMYVRVFMSRNVGWDDYTMFAASLISVVTNAFIMLAYDLGVGRHIFFVPHKNIAPAFMWLWAGEPTNLVAVYLVRLSICLFFIRLVPPKKIYLWTIWITIALLTVSAVLIAVYFFFECRPISKVWNPTMPGQCFPEAYKAAAVWLYQATSVYGDLILLIIPTTLFWRLQVPTRTKVGLIIICSLGIFTNICAIVKTVLLPTLFSSDPDKTWIIRDLCLWAPLELNIGMICGSIPALAPLFGLGLSHPSPSQQQRRYGKFGPHGSYELSSSNSTHHHREKALEQPTRAATVQRQDSDEPIFMAEHLGKSGLGVGKGDETAGAGLGGIRTTYEVEVNSQSVEGLNRIGGGGDNGEQRAHRWNVV